MLEILKGFTKTTKTNFSKRRSRIRTFYIFYKRKFKKFFYEFNLLNRIFEYLSRFFKAIGLKRAGKFLETAVIEDNGLNRNVFFRHIMKELFLYFVIAFLFFFMVFFCNQILLLAENILKKRVPFRDVARLMTYSLPFIIAQSAPFATLVGFLMCLGGLMSANEVLIFRASGQNYSIILIPVVILGAMISLGSFFVNDYLLPLGTIKYNHLYRTILTSNPAVVLESNSVKRTNDKTLVIGNVDDINVSDLVFFDIDSDGKQRMIIAGNSSVEKAKIPGLLMTLNMKNAAVAVLDRNNRRNFDSISAENMELNIFDSSIFESSKAVSPREMTSYDLGKKIKEMKKDQTVSKRVLNQYKLEYNKKFSLPFGSIFFAFLALPLALLFGKHNGQTIGLIIGLFISVAYWAMMIIGQIFGSRSGLSGFWTMWGPNLIILVSALFFYWRLLRK